MAFPFTSSPTVPDYWRATASPINRTEGAVADWVADAACRWPSHAHKNSSSQRISFGMGLRTEEFGE